MYKKKSYFNGYPETPLFYKFMVNFLKYYFSINGQIAAQLCLVVVAKPERNYIK